LYCMCLVFIDSSIQCVCSDILLFFTFVAKTTFNNLLYFVHTFTLVVILCRSYWVLWRKSEFSLWLCLLQWFIWRLTLHRYVCTWASFTWIINFYVVLFNAHNIMWPAKQKNCIVAFYVWAKALGNLEQ